jgi:fructokinase
LQIYGGIDAGGTKFVCVIGSSANDLLAETLFPTTTPKETIDRAIAFFTEYQQRGQRLTSLGIGSFGPVDLDPSSSTYGFITSTPKPGWAQTDFAGRMSRALGLR